MKRLERKLRLALRVPNLLLLTAILPGSIGAQPAVNILTRVLMVRVQNTVGTAFTMDVDGKQYIVTAKHVVQQLRQDDSLLIYLNDSWVPVNVKVFPCADPIDIAVLAPSAQVTYAYSMLPMDAKAGFQFAQDAYFLGFPFGLPLSVFENSPGGLPFPLAKKAIFAGVRATKDGTMFLLDGHNNKGFSGGPVVFKSTLDSGSTFRVAGVVAAYKPEPERVLQLIPVPPSESVPPEKLIEMEGKHYKGEPAMYATSGNSGIILAWSIQHAIDVIKQHPIGATIDPSTIGSTPQK